MKEYIIDRSKWVCGGKKYSNKLGMPQLLNDQGRMCCLGQICKAEDISEGKIKNIADPHFIQRIAPKWMIDNGFNSKVSQKMMRVNDDNKLNQPQREKKLRELAATVGIRLKFKGRLLG